MIGLIPDHAVPVVTSVTALPNTAGLHGVLLITFLILVLEKVVMTAVESRAPWRASGGFSVGLFPLGIATAVVLAQAIG